MDIKLSRRRYFDYMYLFTANIEQDKLAYSIPIIKIDDPLFHSICEKGEPQILVFTNPNTVEGTMNQLINFATKQKKHSS